MKRLALTLLLVACRPEAGSLLTAEAVGGQSLIYKQRTDHYDAANTTTFDQRYYIDSTFADGPQSPVLFLLGGEGMMDLGTMEGTLVDHAHTLHAHMIALEHRYYGKSFPVTDLSTANMKYLSTGQALEDFATFITDMKATRGLTGPWVVTSGSYPGSLAAYLRALHPELVKGAIASSAPVQAKEDFPEYDAHVARSLGAPCAGDVRRLVAAVDEAGQHDAAALDKLMKAYKAPDGWAAVDLGIDLSYGVASFVQDGTGMDRLCNVMTPSDPLVMLAGLRGLLDQAPPPADAQTLHRLAAEAASLRLADGPTGFELPAETEVGGRMWFWQLCTEYGYWQRATDDRSVSVFSASVTLAYFRGLCEQMFQLTTPADAAGTNHRYFERLAGATNVLYVNGSLDPWSELSVTQDPADGAARDVRAYVVAMGSHTVDMNPETPGDSESLKGARTAFDEAVRRWTKP